MVGNNERGAGLKFDGGKPRPSLLIEGMPRALARVADVLTFGAKKYEAHSWKQVQNALERYHDAKVRHQLKRAEGEYLDPESGIEHLAHEICNSLFMLELLLEENEKKCNDPWQKVVVSEKGITVSGTVLVDGRHREQFSLCQAVMRD